MNEVPKWKSSDGRVMDLSEIDGTHLKNILNYLKTKASSGMRTRFVAHVENELLRRKSGGAVIEKIVKDEEPDFVQVFLEILKKIEDKE